MFDPFKVAIVDARPSGLLLRCDEMTAGLCALARRIRRSSGYRQPTMQNYKFHDLHLCDRTAGRRARALAGNAGEVTRTIAQTQAPVLTHAGLLLFEDMNRFPNC